MLSDSAIVMLLLLQIDGARRSDPSRVSDSQPCCSGVSITSQQPEHYSMFPWVGRETTIKARKPHLLSKVFQYPRCTQLEVPFQDTPQERQGKGCPENTGGETSSQGHII